MKLMKRTNIYQSSNYNCTFNPKTLEAHSYKWWKFVGVVDGKLVFNNYRYSVTTAKHQSKVRALLRDLNIKIDIEMPLAKGIESSTCLASMILEAEESLCLRYLNDQVKKQEQYQARKQAKVIQAFRMRVQKLED